MMVKKNASVLALWKEGLTSKNPLVLLVAWQWMAVIWVVVAIVLALVTDVDAKSPSWATPVMVWFGLVNAKKRFGHKHLQIDTTSNVYKCFYIGMSAIMVLLGALIWLLVPVMAALALKDRGIENDPVTWATVVGISYLFLIIQWVFIIYGGGWFIARRIRKSAEARA